MTATTSDRYFADYPPLPEVRVRGSFWFKVAAFAFVVLALLALGGCGVSPAVVESVEDGIAANKGHMADESLSAPARIIATTNHDHFQQIRYALTGQPVDAEVAERKAARDAARAGQ